MAPNDYSDDDEEEEEEEEEVEEEEEDDEEEDEDDEEEEEEEEVSKKRPAKKWKDPNKPKRSMSAFFLYSQAMRSRVKKENPTAGFGDIAKILARQYKELPEKEMRKWEKKQAQDKIRYQEEMKHYVPADDPSGDGGGGGGGKKKKAKKDPNAPKRNMSAYFLFSIDARPKVKEENPDATFGDIARIISKRFKALSSKEKSFWDEKAAEDKERYEREMEEYEG